VTTQHLDPDTLLTALYCIVDDLYQDHFAPLKKTRVGRRPELSDSEVLTLMLLAQWWPQSSERVFLAYAMTHLRAYFPRLLSQSNFNRRARNLMEVMCALGVAIKQRAIAVLGLPLPAYEVLDGVPVPLMRCCRGRRQRLFQQEAALGRGGSDKEWYYGLKLLGCVDAHGFLTGFVAGPANTEERWLAEALLRWRHNPTMPAPTSEELAEVLGPTHRAGGQRKGPSGPLGPRTGVGLASPSPTLADLNYAGATWAEHWRHQYGAGIVTEAIFRHLAEPAHRSATRWLHSLRQAVETVFSQLVGRFGLRFPRARTLCGLHTRLGAKVAAFNIGAFLNRLFGRPHFSFSNPLV
jgi:hypothetical protein